MKHKDLVNSHYAQLCKEYGHLAYHKMIIEKQMKELESKIAGVDSFSPLAESADNLAQRKAKNEGSNESSSGS